LGSFPTSGSTTPPPVWGKGIGKSKITGSKRNQLKKTKGLKSPSTRERENKIDATIDPSSHGKTDGDQQNGGRGKKE